MKTILIVLLAALAVVLTQQLYSDDAKMKAAVLATCNASHKVIDGQLEDACGQAQDAAHAEYLCDSLAPDASCWVELK